MEILLRLGDIFTSEGALFFWKTIATIATAAFGIYGLDVKSRDDSGVFTRKGKIVLVGLVVSALITGVIQLGEFLQGQEQSKEELARSRQVLISLERNVHSLEPLTLAFDIEYSMDDPVLDAYAKRVQALIVSHLRQQRQGRGVTSDDLHEETGGSFLINNLPNNFQPGADSGDGKAHNTLLEDDT